MKKTPVILASAVALVMAGSAIAETTVYGNIRLDLRNQTDLNMASGKLVTGFKSSSDLGNGMTGFMHLELEHDEANHKVSGWDNDLSYVGLKGDFGQVTLGVQNDAAGFACGGTDIFHHGGEACGAGATNGELDNALVYANKFGGVDFVIGKVIQGSAASEPMLVALKYGADNFSIGFQMTDPDVAGGDNMFVLGGTYSINDIKLGLTFADNGGSTNNDAVAVAVQFPVAGGTVKVGVDQGDAITDATHLGYYRNLSKQVYTGMEYESIDVAGSDDLVKVFLGVKF